MSSMLDTVIPNSQQLNADDLIGGQSRTIKITNVTIAMGDQPVSIHYEGDGGKPYKPGKSMRRVIINAWGADTSNYIGRSMTLYRDDKVVFGGVAVGGLRISHMSHINEPLTMALTASRTNRKPFTVQPLVVQEDKTLELLKRNAGVAASKGMGELEAWFKALPKESQAKIKPEMAVFKQIAEKVIP